MIPESMSVTDSSNEATGGKFKPLLLVSGYLGNCDYRITVALRQFLQLTCS